MKNVKVAVIDNGLAVDYLADFVNIKKYVTVRQRVYSESSWGKIEIDRDGKPKHIEMASHGTLVVNTIYKYAKDVPLEFSVYDIFDENDKASGALLIETLRLILEDEVDIIVMSLTCGKQYEDEFKRLCEKIKERDIIFVSSAPNDGKNQCPANLEHVYGVTGGIADVCGKYRYDVGAEFQFWSDVQWEFVGGPTLYSVFCGTSKATAVVAGRLACYLYRNGKEELLSYLSRAHDEFEGVQVEKTYDGNIDVALLLKFCNVFRLTEEACKENMDILIPWNQDNINTFVEFMRHIGLEMDIMNLNYSEFSTLRRILLACERRKVCIFG